MDGRVINVNDKILKERRHESKRENREDEEEDVRQ